MTRLHGPATSWVSGALRRGTLAPSEGSRPEENVRSTGVTSEQPKRDTGSYLDDLNLVTRVRRGEAQAIDELGARLGCIPRFLQTFNGRLSNPLRKQELEDLSQDVTAAVLQSLANFKGLAKLESWIYPMCHGRLLNRLRDLGRRRPTASLDAASDVEEEVHQAVLSEDLERALIEIGPPVEDILRLRALDSLTFVEISQRMGMSLSQVKTRYLDGIQSLRRRVRRDYGDWV